MRPALLQTHSQSRVVGIHIAKMRQIHDYKNQHGSVTRQSQRGTMRRRAELLESLRVVDSFVGLLPGQSSGDRAVALGDGTIRGHHMSTVGSVRVLGNAQMTRIAPRQPVPHVRSPARRPEVRSTIVELIAVSMVNDIEASGQRLHQLVKGHISTQPGVASALVDGDGGVVETSVDVFIHQDFLPFLRPQTQPWIQQPVPGSGPNETLLSPRRILSAATTTNAFLTLPHPASPAVAAAAVASRRIVLSAAAIPTTRLHAPHRTQDVWLSGRGNVAEQGDVYLRLSRSFKSQQTARQRDSWIDPECTEEEWQAAHDRVAALPEERPSRRVGEVILIKRKTGDG